MVSRIEKLMNNTEIYNRAMAKYGYDNQELMLAEECSELIQACLKRRRSETDIHICKGSSLSNLLEELIDVEIMVEQIKLHYEKAGMANMLSRIKDHKLTRLNNRL